MMEEIHKLCTKCLIDKPLSDYSNCKRGLYKKQPKCKGCNKIYREQNRDESINYSKNYYEKNKETLSEKNKEWAEKNKDFVESYKKEWYINNKVTILVKRKLRYEDNKEGIKEYKKEYYQLNKERLISETTTRKKDRRKTDIIFNLRYIISDRIRNSLHSKSKSTCQILGCTIEEFKAHVESQFLNWMSWENYGNVCETLEYKCSWDLDHIIPISSAKTEEELYLLNHWSNFQPLCSKVNRFEKRAICPTLCNTELNIEV